MRKLFIICFALFMLFAPWVVLLTIESVKPLNNVPTGVLGILLILCLAGAITACKLIACLSYNNRA
jgi:hypothetical protein